MPPCRAQKDTVLLAAIQWLKPEAPLCIQGAGPFLAVPPLHGIPWLPAWSSLEPPLLVVLTPLVLLVRPGWLAAYCSHNLPFLCGSNSGFPWYLLQDVLCPDCHASSSTIPQSFTN